MKVKFQLWKTAVLLSQQQTQLVNSFTIQKPNNFVLVLIVVNHKAVDKWVLKHPQIFGITI